MRTKPTEAQKVGWAKGGMGEVQCGVFWIERSKETGAEMGMEKEQIGKQRGLSEMERDKGRALVQESEPASKGKGSLVNYVHLKREVYGCVKDEERGGRL